MTTTARILFYGRLATRPEPVRPGAATVVAEADAEVERLDGLGAAPRPMRLTVVAWGDAGGVLGALAEGDEVQIAGQLVWRGLDDGDGALCVIARSVIPARTLPDEVEELVWMTRDDETRPETAS